MADQSARSSLMPLLSLAPVFALAVLYAGCNQSNPVANASGSSIDTASAIPLVQVTVIIERDGEVVSTPAVILPEGERAQIEIGDPYGEGDVYQLEIIDTEVRLSAILRDGFESIACPELIVSPESQEFGEFSYEGQTVRGTLSVSATIEPAILPGSNQPE